MGENLKIFLTEEKFEKQSTFRTPYENSKFQFAGFAKNFVTQNHFAKMPCEIFRKSKTHCENENALRNLREA